MPERSIKGRIKGFPGALGHMRKEAEPPTCCVFGCRRDE